SLVTLAVCFFHITHPATTSLYTLSLHDALPISVLEEGDSSEKIVKLTVDGTITSDGTSGLFATEGYNHAKFMEQLNAIKEDKTRSEEHTSELQSRFELVCRLLLEKKKKDNDTGK